jgi:hypothetical protein
MLEIFARIELSPLSTAVREVWWVFPAMLVLHSLAMAMMAGTGVVIALRRTGAGAAIAIPQFNALRPLLWLGLVGAAISGAALILAYPAKALTNPLFYLKLILLSAACWLSLQLLREHWQAKRARLLALICVGAWFLVIFAGRFLAYTHSVLLASWLLDVSPAGGL